MQSMTWYRVPSRRELRRRKWKKRKRAVKMAAASVFAGAGVILILMAETYLACGWGGLACISVALAMSRER